MSNSSTSPALPSLRIGLAGFGTVGGGVWRHLHEQAPLLEQRTGHQFLIGGIVTRTWSKAQAAGVPETLKRGHWKELVQDTALDVIIELIGGIDEARDLIRSALLAGKHVITANKALLAHHGEELFALAAQQGRCLLFEASVAGGIPIIKALREGLVANRVLTLYGIINGTCNYMLTQMSARGISYSTALQEAKELGYAEADERLDVDGHDAAHKACILARLAYGFWPNYNEVHVQGISNLDARDVDFAHRMGYEIKLLGIIKADAEGNAEVRVHPTLLPKTHVLASVNGVFNAVLVRGDVVGDVLFYGRGAGAAPTASSVLSDLADLALQHRPSPSHCPVQPTASQPYRLKPMAQVTSRYYLRLMVEDRPGVLAEIAAILGRHKIGISSVIQPEGEEGGQVPLILMVHDAVEENFCNARQAIEALDVVKGRATCLRVEDME